MVKGRGPRIITLTTDFGTKDPFVGIMKGVILGICSGVEIIDITHQIECYQLLEAALVVKATYRYFPSGTIHLIVVDPGVGSERRPLLVETEHHLFVAPDNGVLSLIYREEGWKRVREITARSYFLQEVSDTFHGRDIFAPVAAWLARGENPASFGPPINDYIHLSLPLPVRIDHGLRGEVIYVDRFGNLMSNIEQGLLSSGWSPHSRKYCRVVVGGTVIEGINDYYGQVPPGEVGAIFNSWGYLEIFVNQGSAQQRLSLGTGAKVELLLDQGFS